LCAFFEAQCAYPQLGTTTGIYTQIWPCLRDLCPIFEYFVALEIELFVRVRTCALPTSLVPPINYDLLLCWFDWDWWWRSPFNVCLV